MRAPSEDFQRMRIVEDEAASDRSHEASEISYVHFDIRLVANGKSNDEQRGRLVRAINTYMLNQGFYDPRRLRSFLDEFDEDENQQPVPWTLKRRREVSGNLSSGYYELWRCHDFELRNFIGYLDGTMDAHEGWCDYYIQVIIISDNEDELIRHPAGLNYGHA